ncbi:AraC-like DNA-binding protein [Dyadobacter sp. BE34]|uniref:AraC-like DNA-binding protein n=1 Tax=Dyadobacter fermentans TaxID=94254 RepID=A0ABU1QXX1_9BACT|nr:MULTISPECIES: AraC family transcriptional regulator [Dyadobacter]MDR6805996.1 AraC-like DNA-binding protein [Dyadobacter fermentans]MDR7043736.1 AraC-like DNA-binding protein [Dyadobacter sp. BE242]MDR7198048.1 AraC-like DNA-binding protein [Dyadobacter sp. BE34]MDR7216010.1 AraC-like DNA-binding protein [Dyadobacter sp. BE31]MDR7264464.1 AraC-like DNA-binding protein [Dyadobacter sp. BE32]
MNTYYLPDDLLDDTAAGPDQVVLRYYDSDRDSVRNRIVLNQNMINLLVSGKKTIIYPDATAVVNEGELVVLSTGNVLTSELLAGTDRFTSILFYFSNQVFNRFLIKYEHLLKQNTPKGDKQSFLIFRQDSFIKHFIASLQIVLSNGGSLPAEIRLLRIEELLLYLLQSDPERFRAIEILTRNKQQLQIKKVIESQIGQPTTVDDLAFLCHMSTSTFKRKFREIYHTSPQKWLLARRLELAADLLKSCDESPSGIYMKVGYQNHSSFSEAFRNHFGSTPSDFQQKHLNVAP